MDAQGNRGLWQNRNFLRLWGSYAVSELGTSVTALAVPLVAALTLDATPLEMGVLAAAQGIPVLLFGLVAGVWADRVRRLPIMVSGDLGRALVLLAIPMASWLDVLTLPLLIAVAFLVGVMNIFVDVAAQSLLPAIAGREHLVEATSKVHTSYGFAEVSGPTLAGGLVSLFSAPVAILADVFSYLVSAFLLRGIQVAEAPKAREERQHLLAEIGEGLRYVVREPILRSLALCVGIGNIFDGAFLAMLVLFLTDELEFGAGLAGVVYGIGSAGYLLGTLFPARATRRFGLGRAIGGALWICFVGAVLIAVAGGPQAVAMALVVSGMFVQWWAGPVFDANQSSLRQSIIPDAVRGRVNASLRVVIRGAVPIGALLGGLLAEFAGVRATIIAATLGPVISFLIIWRSPVWPMREIPAAEAMAPVPSGVTS